MASIILVLVFALAGVAFVQAWRGNPYFKYPSFGISAIVKGTGIVYVDDDPDTYTPNVSANESEICYSIARTELYKWNRGTGQWEVAGGGGGGGGTFNLENSSSPASGNTDNVYQGGRIGIGDFSSNTIATSFHIHDDAAAAVRLSDEAPSDEQAMAFWEFYRGYTGTKLGDIGYTVNTDGDLNLRNYITSGGIGFFTDAQQKMRLRPDGSLRLHQYGQGQFTGTVANVLGVTADGSVVETSGGGASIVEYTPSGTNDPSGATGDLAWNDNYLFLKTNGGWKRTDLSTFITFDIDGLASRILHFRPSTLGADGTSVTTWTNEGSLGLDAVPESPTNQPTVKANAINGLSSVLFDGTDDSFVIGDVSSTLGTNEVMIFAVIKMSSVTVSTGIIGQKAASNAPWNLFYRATAGTRITIRDDGTNSQGLDGHTIPPDTWSLLVGRFNGTALYLYSGLTQTATQPMAVTMDTGASGTVYLGSYGNSSQNNMQGEIAEIIVLDDADDTVRQNVTSYLLSKYGL